MSGASDWIYCRLVDRGNFIFPREPFWLGQVEFSNLGESDAECARALTRSMETHAVAASGEGWERLVRARILVPGVPPHDAKQFGDFHLGESLRVFNAHVSLGIGELRQSQAGYCWDIVGRRAIPFEPLRPPASPGGVAAMLDEVAHHPLHVLNTLFVAPTAFGELGDAFRRSSHWAELASRATDDGERLLLHWMAAECLCKASPTEVICPKLLAAVGFPGTSLSRTLPRTVARELAAIPHHRIWRKRLDGLFQALRVARNAIVHAGYRHVDLPSVLTEDQLALAGLVLPLAAKECAGMALMALDIGCRTVRQMWERYPECFEGGIVHHANWFVERLDSA